MVYRFQRLNWDLSAKCWIKTLDKPELYLCWTSFTRVTLAERLKIPSISKPDTQTRTKYQNMGPTRLFFFFFFFGVNKWRSCVFYFLELPCSERKLMVSLITTGTQSSPEPLCLSLNIQSGQDHKLKHIITESSIRESLLWISNLHLLSM